MQMKDRFTSSWEAHKEFLSLIKLQPPVIGGKPTHTYSQKAQHWDIRNKQYSKYILDELDKTTTGKTFHQTNYLPKQAVHFIDRERRKDITQRWARNRERYKIRERRNKLVSAMDKTLDKAKKEFERSQRTQRTIKKGYTTAKIDHNLKTHTQRKTQIRTRNLSQESQRIERKKAGKNHLRKNIDVSTQSNKSLHLIKGTKASKTLHKLAGSRTVRRGAIGLGLMFAASKVYSSITSLSNPTVIPEHYDRAYDLINDTLTDFGSPVKLWKTASKTITPYKSSVRRGIRTSVRQELEGNIALKLADNAIGHMKY